MSSSASSDSGYWPECGSRGSGRASTSLHHSFSHHHEMPWRHSTSSLRMRTSKRCKRKKITSLSSLPPPPSSTSLSPSLSPSPSSSPPPPLQSSRSHPPSLLTATPFGVSSTPSITCTGPSDEHIMCVYLGIQQVISMLQREKCRWEKVLSMSRHEDGRWGGMRRERVDPRGALVPPCYPNLSNTSVAACWATPHPSVAFGLLCLDMNEYLAILRRLYPAATSKVCGMEKGEKKREDSTSNCQRDSSLPSTPNESELIFSSATSPENVSEVDRSAPISVKAFHNGIPVPPIHTEMRGDISSCVSSTSSSSLSHHSRPNIETPLIPSGGVTLTSIPTSSLTTTVSTSKHPPTVSSALPSTMVAHPQRSQEALFRPCASSSRLQYSHPPPQSSHLTSSTSNPMLHQQQPITPFLQPPPTSVNVMEQSEDGARMGINGVVSGSRKEESLSSSRSPFLSAAHPVSWSTAASGIGSGGVGGSLPPRAPPSGFVDEGGRFMISEMDYLSEEIWHFHHTMTQTESTCSRKLHLRDMLYYAICPVFPMCGLYVVGSSLNGFGNNSSDMDLCLMITNKDLDQKTDAVLVLNMILKQLVNVEWVAHQQLILAKVPILRIQFTAPFGDITVDLNANNSVAIKNTHLLCYYSSFDWRVRPLVTIVKEWAKKKGINDANRSSFTSYSLVLMVIHYLQCGVEQPVLPSLQSMYARRFSRTADVRSLNVSIPLAHPPEEWTFNETSSLGELLIGFLEYFALKFDYNQHAISVRMGRKLDRTAVVRSRAQYPQQSNNWRSQWRCVCIEEPFTFSNTAHSVYDEMVFTKIKEAFKDAYHLLESTRDLNKLMDCAPIAVPNLPHGNGAVVLMGGCHADTSVVASSSSSSLSAPHSGHASSASSSCGEEEVVVGVDKERVDASRSIPSSTHCNMKKDYSPPLQSSSHSNDRSNEQECTPVVSVNQ